MTRITDKDLQAVVDRINRAAGTPLQPYGPSIDGKCNPQAKCYHLNHAYGGVTLHQMADTGTGVRSIISGYRPKRELYELLHAYLSGMTYNAN